jgi:hypothetical protein
VICALAATCLGLLPAGAAAAGAGPTEALDAARAALDPDPGAPLETSRDVTHVLRDLAFALPRLEGAERRAAKRILARPTDGALADPDGYLAQEEPPYCSAHFCVHYVATTGDAPDMSSSAPTDPVPTYVKAVSDAAETSFAVQNGQLGWPAPAADGSRGGAANLTDIYLADVGGGDQGIFGYTAPDPPPAQNCVRQCFAYLVLDNDYAPDEFGPIDPGVAMRVTMAHEYNHVLQYAIDAVQDLWLFESSAVWAEEKTFPADDDWHNYLPTFASTPSIPITDFNGAKGRRIYGLGVFQHWLDSGNGNFGPSVVLGSWLSSAKTRPKDFGIAAVDRSIRAHGGKGFANEFAEFAAASAEWQVAGGFPDAATYPDVRRKGSLKRGQRQKRIVLDHAAYRLLNVPATSRSKLTLRVSGEPQVDAAVALVGRDDDTATVTRKVKLLKRNGSGKVTLPRASAYERITAGIVNADDQITGFSRTRLDWVYASNNVPFFASLR